MARTSSIKQKICQHAQQLFNEKGYENVSLREIAESAGTTIGNLTYHFPQKEVLLEAIQHELHLEFENEFFANLNNKNILENIYLSFTNSQINREKNPFYYKYVFELCKDSCTLAHNNEQFRKKLYEFYIHSFTALRIQGVMRNDIPEKQYETLAYTIVFMQALWIQNSTPYYDMALPKISLANALRDMIYPYLTV
jgi:AcrR family transcriptional regulator